MPYPGAPGIAERLPRHCNDAVSCSHDALSTAMGRPVAVAVQRFVERRAIQQPLVDDPPKTNEGSKWEMTSTATAVLSKSKSRR